MDTEGRADVGGLLPQLQPGLVWVLWRWDCPVTLTFQIGQAICRRMFHQLSVIHDGCDSSLQLSWQRKRGREDWVGRDF